MRKFARNFGLSTKYMKQIRILYLLLAAIMVLASCSKTDDSSTTLYSDAAITAFTLGTMTRVDGDTKKTYAGSAYQFFIDQKTRVVYNVDSLPIGTDVTAVYCAVSTLNNGLAMLVDHTTETMSYHSSSTPVDFTEPRKFRIYSSDGSGYTTYTIKVNVHKEDGDKLVWTQMGGIPFPAVDDLPEGIKQVLGKSTVEKYGLSTDNKLMVLHKDGDTWETVWEQDLPDDAENADLLPTEDVALVSYPMYLSDSTDYVLLAGTSSACTTRSMVWRKIVDYSRLGLEPHWSLIERSDNDKYNLPILENLSLIRYDDSILAFGGDYKTIYQSRDNGITWKTNKIFYMPEGFDYTTTRVTVVTDEENYIWLYCEGTEQVWRGRLNYMGWDDYRYYMSR